MDEAYCRPFSFTRSLLFVNCQLLFKFIAVENLQNPQSETVINKYKKVFSKFGTPKEPVMDNCPEFSSHKCHLFLKAWDILHKTISLRYHQSNGLAERSVQTVKQTVNKAKLNSEDQFLAVLFLNSQPDQNETSPAEKLFGHKLRTTLPFLYHLPKVPPPKSILPKT